jgi:hypothetical protein
MCASNTYKYRLQKEQKGVFVMKQLIKVSWHQFMIFESFYNTVYQVVVEQWHSQPQSVFL